LVALFGEPVEHTVRSDYDQHTGRYRVEFHHASFPGAEAWFAIAEAMGPAIQWQRFVLSRPGARIPPETWVGERLSGGAARLGPPDKVADGRAHYACDENRELVLVLQRDKVSAIEWLGYLD